MGCAEGRSREDWIDFDFHGHQIVAHLAPGHAQMTERQPRRRPGRAGAALRRLVDADVARAGRTAARRRRVHFVIEPYVRFKGEPGEQATMFFLDPSGNALEFKAFADMNSLFAT